MNAPELRAFARERLAGYSPQILEAPLLVLGAGAGGSALTCLLAMWGFRRVTLCDPATYDPSNATRVLDFPHRRVRAGRRVFKALERSALWRRRLRAARHPADAVRGIVGYAQELPPQAWQRAAIVISCVDHPRARFDISLLARRYQKPLILAGFDAEQRGATVEYFPAAQDAACVRCAIDRDPEYGASSISCSAVGLRAAEARKLPATPNLAAASALLLAQLLVDGLSLGWPTGAEVHRLSLPPQSRMRSGSFAIDRHPSCPHHRVAERFRASLSGSTLQQVLGALNRAIPGCRLELLDRIPINTMADDDQTLVRVALPPWRCPSVFSTREFPAAPAGSSLLALDYMNLELARRFAIGRMPARWFGLGPGAIASIVEASGRALDVHDE